MTQAGLEAETQYRKDNNWKTPPDAMQVCTSEAFKTLNEIVDPCNRK